MIHTCLDMKWHHVCMYLNVPEIMRRKMDVKKKKCLTKITNPPTDWISFSFKVFGLKKLQNFVPIVR